MASAPVVDPSSDAPRLAHPDRIGMRWGAVFALPWFAIAVLALGSEHRPYVAYLVEAAPLCVASVLLAFTGVWWATRDGGRRTAVVLVLTSVAVGFALIALLAAALLLDDWRLGKPPTVALRSYRALPFVVGWGLATAWALALLAIVSLHLRRALRRAHGAPEPAQAGEPARGRDFALALAAALGVPLLLAVPVVLLLRHDRQVRAEANAILSEETGRIRAQVGDLKDLENVKARLLARLQILRVLEPSAAEAADVLGVFGRWPDRVQLRSLEMRGGRASFVVHGARPSNEQAVADLLSTQGFRDVRVARAPATGEGGVALATVEATSTRMDGQ